MEEMINRSSVNFSMVDASYLNNTNPSLCIRIKYQVDNGFEIIFERDCNFEIRVNISLNDKELRRTLH